MQRKWSRGRWLLALAAALLPLTAHGAEPRPKPTPPTTREASPPATGETSVAALVQAVQARYEGTHDLKGKFKQVYTDQLYGRSRTSYGYLFVKKPGMMRWNYAAPERKAFISDGKVLWVWEPADKQAFRNPLDLRTLSTGLTFLLGAGELRREFNIAFATDPRDRLGGPDDAVLKLTPKQPSAQLDYLVLVVRRSDHAVVESMIVNESSTNHLLFSQLVFNSRLGNERFRFRPSADTRVVEGAKPERP